MYITVAMIASAVIQGWEDQCEVVGRGSGLFVKVHSNCRMSVASVLSLDCCSRVCWNCVWQAAVVPLTS